MKHKSFIDKVLIFLCEDDELMKRESELQYACSESPIELVSKPFINTQV